MKRLENTPTSCYLKSQQLRNLQNTLLQVANSLETPHDIEIYSHHFNSILCSDYAEFRESIVSDTQLLGYGRKINKDQINLLPNHIYTSQSSMYIIFTELKTQGCCTPRILLLYTCTAISSEQKITTEYYRFLSLKVYKLLYGSNDTTIGEK